MGEVIFVKDEATLDGFDVFVFVDKIGRKLDRWYGLRGFDTIGLRRLRHCWSFY